MSPTKDYQSDEVDQQTHKAVKYDVNQVIPEGVAAMQKVIPSQSKHCYGSV